MSGLDDIGAPDGLNGKTRKKEGLDDKVLYGIIGGVALVVLLVAVLAGMMGSDTKSKKKHKGRSSSGRSRSGRTYYRRTPRVGPGAVRTPEEARRRWEQMHLGR